MNDNIECVYETKGINGEGRAIHYEAFIVKQDMPIVVIINKFMTKNHKLIENIIKKEEAGFIMRETKWGYLIKREICFPLSVLSRINDGITEFARELCSKKPTPPVTNLFLKDSKPN